MAAFVGKQPVRVPATQAHSLHPPRTEEQPQACSIGRPEVPDGSGAKAKRQTVAAFVGKQPVRVPARQAHSLHPPRTEEQPQACSIGWRSLTAPVPSTVAS